MLYKDLVNLIGIEIYKDELLQEKTRETKRQVFCDKKSASQTEFYQAGQAGISPQFVFIVRTPDYEFESKLEYNGIDYSIYRTYERGEFIELYTTKKVGA